MTARGRVVDSSMSLANTVTTMAAAFLTYRIVSQQLGVDTFGLWALASAALFPLRFADLSINSAVLRYIGVARGPGIRKILLKVVSAALATNLLAFGLFLAAAWFITPTVIRSTVDPGRQAEAFALLPYLVLASVSQLCAGVFSSAVLGLHRYRFVYAVGIACSVAQLLAVSPLIGRFGIAGYAILQTVTWLAQAAAFSLVIALHRGEGRDGGDAPFDARSFFGLAFKLNANAVLATMVEPLGKLLLGRFGSLSAVGIYEITLRIYNQARGLAFAPMQPAAIAMIREHAEDRAAFVRTYQMSLLYSIVVAGAFLCSILPGWVVLEAVLAIHDPLLPWVVATVAIAIVFAFPAIPAYNASIAAVDVRPILACTVVYLATTGILGLVLGALFGWVGVLWAIAIGSLISNAVQITLAGRLLGFETIPRPAHLVALAKDGGEALRREGARIFARRRRTGSR